MQGDGTIHAVYLALGIFVVGGGGRFHEWRDMLSIDILRRIREALRKRRIDKYLRLLNRLGGDFRSRWTRTLEELEARPDPDAADGLVAHVWNYGTHHNMYLTAEGKRVLPILRKIGAPALPALRDVLLHSRWGGGTPAAARLIGDIGGDSAVEALLTCLRTSRESRVSKAAAEALAALHWVPGVASDHALLAIALEDTERVLSLGVESIAALADTFEREWDLHSYWPPAGLGDAGIWASDTRVASWRLSCLVRLGEPGHQQLLSVLRHVENRPGRYRVAEALGDSGFRADSPFLRALIAVLDGDDRSMALLPDASICILLSIFPTDYPPHDTVDQIAALLRSRAASVGRDTLLTITQMPEFLHYPDYSPHDCRPVRTLAAHELARRGQTDA